MSNRNFVHLHCHTHYSLLDGANRIPELIAQTKKLGMNSIAITDHGNLYGAIEFYNECKSASINPVIGYEAYVAPNSRFEKKAGKQGDAYSHLTLLAKNNTGFKNLIKLASIAFLEGFYYNPRIDWEILEAHKEGLICLSGCLAGEFNDWILRGDTQEGRRPGALVQQSFRATTSTSRFKTTVSTCKTDVPSRPSASPTNWDCRWWPRQMPIISASKTPRPTTFSSASTPAKKRDPNKKSYPEGRDSQPVLSSARRKICTGCFRNRRRGPTQPGDRRRGRHPARLQETALSGLHAARKQDARKNTCANFANEGIARRYGDNPRPEVLRPARTRARHHLQDGLRQLFPHRLGFRPLRHREGHPVQPRGSGCGAIVSYVLNLSHVYPLEYDLLFERFLDPNRTEAPDIDIDFCQDRREEVIEYVKRKVRRAERGPDRHLRHHGGQGGHQGRWPGSRHSARPRQSS